MYEAVYGVKLSVDKDITENPSRVTNNPYVPWCVSGLREDPYATLLFCLYVQMILFASCLFLFWQSYYAVRLYDALCV